MNDMHTMQASAPQLPSSASSNVERSSAVDWASYQLRIRKLYIDQDLSLKDVMGIMKEHHGFNASSKMYKAHLRKWGYSKYIRTAGKLDNDNLQQALFKVLHGPRDSRDLRLADGRAVDRQRLATHLLRKSKVGGFGKDGKRYRSQAPHMMRSPDTLYAVEALLNSARTYVICQHETATASISAGSSDSKKLSPLAYDDVRAAQRPQWEKWAHFVYGVKNALEEKKFNFALVLMREAPMQMDLWMRSHGINVLSGLLMFVTYCARFCATMEPWREIEFLKVMKALVKYGDQSAASQDDMSLSSEHPLRRALKTLSTMDTSLFRQASQKAWVVSLQTQDESLGYSGSIVSIKDWTWLNTSTTEMEYPPDFEKLMDEALTNLELRLGESHPECLDLLWRKAIYLIEKDEAQGVDPVLNANHLVVMREIIRRGCEGKPLCSAFRFFADHQRAVGEKESALKNLRASIDGLIAIYGDKDVLVIGFISELKDWLLESEDFEEAAVVGKWLERLQSAAKIEVAEELE